MGQGQKALKPPSRQASLSKGPTAFPSNAIPQCQCVWGQSIQTHEPVGKTSYSNRSACHAEKEGALQLGSEHVLIKDIASLSEKYEVKERKGRR